MSNVTSGTSAGRQTVADILLALVKSIGDRADAYCWHINGDDGPYKESSLAHLLGISQLEIELIMKMCGCFDKEGLLLDLPLNRLVDMIGKEHCELIKYRFTQSDKSRKMLYILRRIGRVDGENAIALPKKQFKDGVTVLGSLNQKRPNFLTY